MAELDRERAGKIFHGRPPFALPMPERHNAAPRPLADARDAARHAIRRAAAAVAGLVYPDLCLGCDRRLPERLEADPLAGLPLCPTCLAGLPAAPPVEAPALAEALASGVIERAVALWAYDAGGTVRRVQHALKYGGQERLGSPVGHLIGQAWARTGGAPVDVVVPVPLASVRLLERGYNQAAGLARGSAEALGAEARTDRLARTRPTRSQTALSADQRRANVDGAFSVPAGADLAGLHVLLVDDVLTTGATLVAAARPLVAAGACVSVAAMASVA